jgi:4-aminobutyrate aminotransferase-like enzyme
MLPQVLAEAVSSMRSKFLVQTKIIRHLNEAQMLRHELILLNHMKTSRGFASPELEALIRAKQAEVGAIAQKDTSEEDLQLVANVGTDVISKAGAIQFPGPKVKEVLTRCADSGVDAFGSVHTSINIQNSYGMYAVDADGVPRLEMLGHIASNALGYNHPLMTEKHLEQDTIGSATARVASGIIVTEDYIKTVEAVREINAELSLDKRNFYFQFQSDGTAANENACKAALMVRKEWDELEGVKMDGKLVMASFDNAFHGRSAWMLSLLHSPNRPHFCKGVPLIESAKLMYPPMNATEEEEDQVVATNTFVIECWNGRIGGAIIEPIQAEGGDKHCSGRFLAKMQELFDQHRIILIVDEVQSGMGVAGTLWAYESLTYNGEIALKPDIVTWSKKAQVGGYHYTDRIRDALKNQPFRIFNTWLGDPRKVKDMLVTLQYIRDHNILKLSEELGEQFFKVISGVMDEYPEVTNCRGRGTLVAFDLPSPAERNEFLALVKNNGAVMAGTFFSIFCDTRFHNILKTFFIRNQRIVIVTLKKGCGTCSIRLRPPLICRKAHVDQWEDILKKTLAVLFTRYM